MRIKLLSIIFLGAFYFCNAQLEPISTVIVGGGSDFTNQPYSPQSNFSRTQTIYYPEQLKFNGEITGIRFFTAFSNSTTSPTPNTNFVFKIGHTTKTEFQSGDAFISDTELTTIAVSTYYANGDEWFFVFDESFNYNGIDNLVIDVEDVNSFASTSSLAGFKGAENFNNPPTRSIVSLTIINEENSTQSTAILYENSYAKTQFDGNLERCMWITVSDIDNITNDSADVTVLEATAANHYRYTVYESGEEISATYDISTTEQFSVSGLEAAQDYYVAVKSDCDNLGNNADYRSYPFKTRPNTITVPSVIDFEGVFNRDYSISQYGTEISDEAANGNSIGLELYGFEYPANLSWNDSGNPFQNNQSYVRSFSVDVDLTQNAISPVLRFDIYQTFGTSLRVKVKDFGDDAVYSGVAEDFVYNGTSNSSEFETVSIDLSEYVGSVVTIKLEHVSKTNTQKTYLDNIQIIENDCDNINSIASQSSVDSILLNWDATTENTYEVLATPFNENPGVDYTSIVSNNHTFNTLPAATSYKFFVRNNCASVNSPWEKVYASTEPEFLEVGFDSEFSETSLTSGFFSILNSNSSNVEIVNYSINEYFTLHQRNSNEEWVGGDATTESQAWNDNKDFITGLKFKIDGASISEGSLDLTYRQLHHYYSTAANSWFRILINGTQFGPSYNPTTRYQDPFTTINIDLAPYIGEVIEIELQHVGRIKDDFSLTAIGGDGTILKQLVFTGTALSVEDVEVSKISLHPNPASSIITIQGLNTEAKISLYDSSGRQLKTILTEDDVLGIDISEFNVGLYFAEISTRNKIQTYKFIKN